MTDTLKVVALKEKDYWIAQCVDYDLVSQAAKLEDLFSKFMIDLAAHIKIREKHNQDPFDVPAAPENSKIFFEHARFSLKSLRDFPGIVVDGDETVKLPQIDMRIFMTKEVSVDASS